jgi:hypothetical protein
MMVGQHRFQESKVALLSVAITIVKTELSKIIQKRRLYQKVVSGRNGACFDELESFLVQDLCSLEILLDRKHLGIAFAENMIDKGFVVENHGRSDSNIYFGAPKGFFVNAMDEQYPVTK